MATAFTKLALYVFTFLGVFTLLFSAIDTEFFQASYSATVGSTPTIANTFNLNNVTLYDSTGNDTMIYPYSSLSDHWTGDEQYNAGLPSTEYLEVWWGTEVPAFGRYLEYRHVATHWWGNSLVDRGNFRGVETGTEYTYALTKQDVIDEEVNNSSAFSGACDHVLASIIIEFNETAYPDIGVAWDSGDLDYSLSYEFNYNSSQLSAFTILGQLLTFETPSLGIDGTGGIVLSGLIAVPFMIMVILLILLLVQSLIPFIKGL